MRENPPHIGKIHRPFSKVLHERPRLFLSIALGIVIGVLLPGDWRIATRIIVAWDLATFSYIALAMQMVHATSTEKIRKRARYQTEGKLTILFLSLLAGLASLGATIWQLAAVKDLSGLDKALHISLAMITICISFTFIHLIFTLYYAHEYYADTPKASPEIDDHDEIHTIRRGLIFPGTSAPSYADFAYMSFVIGVACQTADVAISSTPLRMIALTQGIVAFLFNSMVLALTINIAAGLM